MFGIDIWFITTCILGFLLALSLWKNITGWKELKSEAVNTIKSLLELLSQHQATANDIARLRITADPSMNPNVAGVGVQSADRKG